MRYHLHGWREYRHTPWVAARVFNALVGTLYGWFAGARPSIWVCGGWADLTGRCRRLASRSSSTELDPAVFDA